MIDLYTWTTPNGRKASIMLEELGLDYAVHPINIGEGEQFKPDFLKISPTTKSRRSSITKRTYRFSSQERSWSISRKRPARRCCPKMDPRARKHSNG